MKIILGSASLRRHELMNLLNVPYEVIVSDEDEVYDKNKTLYEQCIDISYHKALNVYKRTSGDRIVIGSDTVVIFNNKIYGKPKDLNDAYKMIKELSGNYHEVVTSLTFLVFDGNNYFEEKTYEVVKVYVDSLNDEEIYDWINNHNVMDMAGGYAIQQEFGKFITKIEGDYFSIVGFPLNKVYQLLKKYYHCD